jgi:hypothetical protein
MTVRDLRGFSPHLNVTVLRTCCCIRCTLTWQASYRIPRRTLSQLEICHFWVIGIERNVCICTFNKYSVITQFAKLAAGEQLCLHCANRKLQHCKTFKSFWKITGFELWHCCGTVVALLWHCCDTVVALLWHCCGIVVALLWHCCGTVVALLWHCCDTVVALLWHCSSRGAICFCYFYYYIYFCLLLSRKLSSCTNSAAHSAGSVGLPDI